MSHLTLVRSHCSCASHGTVYLDGSGAWSQTTASGNAPCLSALRWCLGLQQAWKLCRSSWRTCGKKCRVDTEIGRSGRFSNLNTESTASPLPSLNDTSLLKQQAFDGDRKKWADWAFTFRACASAVSTRMVVLVEHAQCATEPLTLPKVPSDKQVNAQLYNVLAMLVKRWSREEGSKRSHGTRQ